MARTVVNREQCPVFGAVGPFFLDLFLRKDEQIELILERLTG
jgi:hypothetical protein